MKICDARYLYLYLFIFKLLSPSLSFSTIIPAFSLPFSLAPKALPFLLFSPPPLCFQSDHFISSLLLFLLLLCLPHHFSHCLFNKEESVEESASTPSSLHWTTVSLRQETCWHTRTHTHHHFILWDYIGYPLPSFLFYAVCIILTFSPWILLLLLLLTFSFLCTHVIRFVFWHFLAVFVLTNHFSFSPLNSFLVLYWHFLSFCSFIFLLSPVLCFIFSFA